MSHECASKIRIMDLAALHKALEGCPELELRRASEYKWYGRSVGDYAPPALRQLSAIVDMVKEGHDVRAKAKEAGVELPANLADLEYSPLSLDDINKLRQIPEFKAALDKQAERIGKDAEFVIGYKEGHPKHGQAYEIGVIPHPTREGEYWMSVDYWQNGYGLFNAEGLGDVVEETHTETAEDGTTKEVTSTDWGQDLRQRYTLFAMQNRAEATGRRVTNVVKQEDGSLRMEIEE